MTPAPVAFHLSKKFCPRLLVLFLCFALVFSPWIFIPAATGFSGKVYAAPINITGGTITTRQDAGNDTITIQGNANVTIAGNGTVIPAGGALSTTGNMLIKDSTIQLSNNQAQNGGGISSGKLELSNVTGTFSGNIAGQNGGAICSSADVFIKDGSNLTFTNNKASGTSGIHAKDPVYIHQSSVTFTGGNSSGVGGNICSGSFIEILNSTVSFIDTFDRECAGLHSAGIVNVTNSSLLFDNNKVVSFAAGLHSISDLIFTNSNATFTNNAITPGQLGVGGFRISGNFANFTDVNMDFTNNSGNNGGGLGIDKGTTTLKGGTISFAGNKANTTGAGLHAGGNVTMSSITATFINNTAGTHGGGVYAAGTVKYNASTIHFEDNKAVIGGGFHVQSGGVQIQDSNLTILNNSASTSGGGFNVAAGSATFRDSTATFTNNKVTGNLSTNAGGGFAIGGGSVTFDNTTATFVSNSAQKGGGFHTDGNLSLISATLTFNGNNATIGGGFNVGLGSATFAGTNATFTANTATSKGGGFNVDSGNATFIHSTATFAQNTADKGGGFSVGIGGSVTVSGTGMVTFTKNNATQGGGLWSGGNVMLAGATRVFNNTATEGGGIYAANSTVSFSGSATIAGNNAVSGGGIYAQGTVALSGAGTAAVTGNNATEGGGIYADGTVSIAGANAQFSNNTAIRGGGIYTAAGSGVHMVGNANFTDNKATGSGGGLYASGNATLTGGAGGFVAFSRNNATHGGGIYAKDSVNISGTGGEFRDNTATEGGGIWAENGVHLAPGTGQVLTFATAADNIFINNATAKLTIGGEGVTVFRSTNNRVPGGVDISKGRTELRGPAVFENTPMRVVDSTLYMGDGAFDGTARNASTALTVTPRSLALSGSSIGSGAATPYSQDLTSFHLDNNAVLALEMNHPGDAAVPYFTLRNGKATTGTNTGIHGIIGTNLDQGVDFTHTYVIFSGSTGTLADFTPTHYTTSHALVALANPIYDAATGTFALQVVRGSVQPLPPPPPPPPPPPTPDPDPVPTPDPDPVPPPAPDPDPVPPTPDPDPTPPPVVTPDPDPMPPAPDPVPVPPAPKPTPPESDKTIYVEIRDMLQNDYLYNGENQQGTLIGKNPLLDAIYYVKPDGKALLNDKERLKALASAVHMGVYISAREIMFEAHSQLRSMLFPFRNTPGTGGITASVGFTPDTTVRWADAARLAEELHSPAVPENSMTLWTQPFYSYETLRGGTLTDGLRADYDLHLYGGALGGDITFGNGEYVLGGVFAAGRGNMETSGKDLAAMTNNADFAGGLASLRWLPIPGAELGVYAGLLHQRNKVEQANVLPVKAEFDSMLYQAGVNLRHQLAVGHDGARVLSIDTGADMLHFRQDAVTATAMNRPVGRLEELETTTVLLPITFGLRDSFEFDDGSRLSLDASLGYRLALGDRRVNGRWRVAGGVHPVSAQGLEMDTHTATAGLGVQWEKGDFALRLNYEVEMGRRQRNHMLMGRIFWEF